MKHKGIILKLKKEYAIVLTDDSRYEKIHIKDNLFVGQKILFTSQDIIKSKNWRVLTMNARKSISIAAAVLIILAGGLFISSMDRVMATFTIDINPSVKVSVNDEGEVVKYISLNEDAETLDLTSIIGMNIEDAIEVIVDSATVAGFINVDDLEDDYILISSVTLNKKNSEKVEKIEDAIREKSKNSETLNNMNVALIKATKVEQRIAEDKKVPLGLLVVKGEITIDDETMTVKEYFSNSDNVNEFQNKGEIIKQNFEQKIKNMEKNIDELGDEEFDEAEEILEKAKEEYKESLQSGTNDQIKAAAGLVEKAKSNKAEMEGKNEEAGNSETIENGNNNESESTSGNSNSSGNESSSQNSNSSGGKKP